MTSTEKTGVEETYQGSNFVVTKSVLKAALSSNYVKTIHWKGKTLNICDKVVNNRYLVSSLSELNFGYLSKLKLATADFNMARMSYFKYFSRELSTLYEVSILVEKDDNNRNVQEVLKNLIGNLHGSRFYVYKKGERTSSTIYSNFQPKGIVFHALFMTRRNTRSLPNAWKHDLIPVGYDATSLFQVQIDSPMQDETVHSSENAFTLSFYEYRRILLADFEQYSRSNSLINRDLRILHRTVCPKEYSPFKLFFTALSLENGALL